LERSEVLRERGDDRVGLVASVADVDPAAGRHEWLDTDDGVFGRQWAEDADAALVAGPLVVLAFARSPRELHQRTNSNSPARAGPLRFERYGDLFEVAGPLDVGRDRGRRPAIVIPGDGVSTADDQSGEGTVCSGRP